MALIETAKELLKACEKPYENWSGLKEYVKAKVKDKETAKKTAMKLSDYGMDSEIIIELFKSSDLDRWNDIYPA